MTISNKTVILIVLLIASVLLILKMIVGIPYIICLIIAALIGITMAFLMRHGIIKVEGIDIKK